LPDVPIDEATWPAVLAAVREQRLTGLLADAIRTGAMAATEPQSAQAAAVARLAAAHDLGLELALVDTVERLDVARIPYRALKGSTTARRIYPTPTWRSFSDVDVLVPGDRFDEAVALLTHAGGQRRYPEARPGFDRRFSKGASFAMPAGHVVDLHRTFVVGPFGFRVDLDGIFARSADVVLGDRSVRCLELHDTFLHACFHAALGDWPPRLVPQRDVAQLLEHPDLDPDLVRRRSSTWGADAVIATALRLAQAAFGLAPDHLLLRWATGRRPSLLERRQLDVYGPGRTYRRQAVAALPMVPGVRGKLAYARDLAWRGR
jgi:hypothetical protein